MTETITQLPAEGRKRKPGTIGCGWRSPPGRIAQAALSSRGRWMPLNSPDNPRGDRASPSPEALWAIVVRDSINRMSSRRNHDRCFILAQMIAAIYIYS
jgi:hypothetical protein